MGRKKKEEAPKDSYDVLIGYVHEWSYSTEGGSDHMNGHPMVGRCYRLIKDDNGYRLHIGRENNSAGLDGLFLGPELTAERKDFAFDIEVLRPENLLALDINSEDLAKIDEWTKENNKDLWDKIKLEKDGTIPVVRSLADLINLMRKADLPSPKQQDEQKEPEEDYTDIVAELSVTPVNVADDHDNLAASVSESLNFIHDQDLDMIRVIEAVLSHVSRTYSINQSNLSKIISQDPEMGKGANIFSAVKHLEQYASTGFDSSTEDILKAIHYLLFEIQRRQHNQ